MKLLTKKTALIASALFGLTSCAGMLPATRQVKVYALVQTKPYTQGTDVKTAAPGSMVYKHEVRPAFVVKLDADIGKIKGPGKWDLKTGDQLFLTRTPGLGGVTFCTFEGAFKPVLYIKGIDRKPRVCLTDTDKDKNFDRLAMLTEPAPALDIGGGTFYETYDKEDKPVLAKFPPLPYSEANGDISVNTWVGLKYSTPAFGSPMLSIVQINGEKEVVISDQTIKIPKSEELPKTVYLSGVGIEILARGGKNSTDSNLAKNELKYRIVTPMNADERISLIRTITTVYY